MLLQLLRTGDVDLLLLLFTAKPLALIAASLRLTALSIRRFLSHGSSSATVRIPIPPDTDIDLDLDMSLLVSNLDMFNLPKEVLTPSCGRGCAFGGGGRNLVRAGGPGLPLPLPFSCGGALRMDLDCSRCCAPVCMLFVSWSVGAAASTAAGADAVVVVVGGVDGVVGLGVGVGRDEGSMALARADLYSFDMV